METGNHSTKQLISINSLTEGNTAPITIRGFIHTQRVKSRFTFLVLRQGLDTLQCIYNSGMPNYKTLTQLTSESFIEVIGTPTVAKISSCSIKNIEIQVLEINVISSASELPIGVKEASATHDEILKQRVPQIQISKLLDNRSLHLRTFQCQSIFRIQSMAMHLFRDYLLKKQFIEIKTSKLIESSSEGGANVFEVSYFDTKAFLAQSPQLYKQMAVLGGFERVFEIGHVYRAEESNTNRYLSEFVGVDIEMQIVESVNEVIHVIYKMLTSVFDGIKRECPTEFEAVRAFKPFNDVRFGPMPFIIEFKQCVELLFEKGIVVEGDFNRESEKILGEIVAEREGVDLFVIRNYPKKVRAFYTKGTDDGMSLSFDFIMRGEEILSGAERINTYDELLQSVVDKGVKPDTLRGYLDSFRYGAPRHGGCGIGFERVMKTFFNFDDIRYFNMFPRDPTRLFP